MPCIFNLDYKDTGKSYFLLGTLIVATNHHNKRKNTSRYKVSLKSQGSLTTTTIIKNLLTCSFEPSGLCYYTIEFIFLGGS